MGSKFTEKACGDCGAGSAARDPRERPLYDSTAAAPPSSPLLHSVIGLIGAAVSASQPTSIPQGRERERTKASSHCTQRSCLAVQGMVRLQLLVDLNVRMHVRNNDLRALRAQRSLEE